MKRTLYVVTRSQWCYQEIGRRIAMTLKNGVGVLSVMAATLENRKTMKECEYEKGEETVNKLYHLNLEDMAYYFAQSWESVGANTIAKSRKVLLQENEESPCGENVEKETEPDNTRLPLLQQVPGNIKATEEDVSE
ncbi:hypothetical protein J6590_058719 [Homalodisca vitripennis]|nr:hypothetical protein J6590_058719 [Homalodisca vitripennis]